MSFLRPRLKRLSSSSTKSAESTPAQTPPAFPIPSSVATQIQVDIRLPSILAAPVCAIVSSVTTSKCTTLSYRLMQDTELALEAQAYFAACKQLYSLMTPAQRTSLGPLAAIASEGAILPQCLAVALFSLLSVETNLGMVKVKDSPLLFRRWLAKALTIFPGSRYTGKDVEGIIWTDSATKQWLNEQLALFADGDNEVAVQCRQLTEARQVPLTSPIYGLLGVHVASAEFQDKPMADQMVRNIQLYNDRYNVIIGTVLRNAEF